MNDWSADPRGALLEHLRGDCHCRIIDERLLTVRTTLPIIPTCGQFLFLLEGQCRIESTVSDSRTTAENASWELSSGMALLVPVDHSVVVDPAEGTGVHLLIGAVHLSDQNWLAVNELWPAWLVIGGSSSPTSLREELLEFAALEARRKGDGARSMVSSLLTTICLDVLRANLCGLEQPETGWLKGFLDDDLGPILALMFKRPEDPWTVASLAAAGQMARSSFARRFRAIVGDTPLDLLTEIRMRKAQKLLERSSAGLKQIAHQVGYRTVGSFAAAFRRELALSPMEYRHRARGNGTINTSKDDSSASFAISEAGTHRS